MSSSGHEDYHQSSSEFTVLCDLLGFSKLHCGDLESEEAASSFIIVEDGEAPSIEAVTAEEEGVTSDEAIIEGEEAETKEDGETSGVSEAEESYNEESERDVSYEEADDEEEDVHEEVIYGTEAESLDETYEDTVADWSYPQEEMARYMLYDENARDANDCQEVNFSDSAGPCRTPTSAIMPASPSSLESEYAASRYPSRIRRRNMKCRVNLYAQFAAVCPSPPKVSVISSYFRKRSVLKGYINKPQDRSCQPIRMGSITEKAKLLRQYVQEGVVSNVLNLSNRASVIMYAHTPSSSMNNTPPDDDIEMEWQNDMENVEIHLG